MKGCEDHAREESHSIGIFEQEMKNVEDPKIIVINAYIFKYDSVDLLTCYLINASQ